jgi:hypothetical protein
MEYSSWQSIIKAIRQSAMESKIRGIPLASNGSDSGWDLYKERRKREEKSH